MKKIDQISSLLTVLVTSLLLLISMPAISATSSVVLTVGGSTGPISATTGTPVVFDVTVVCETTDELVYVPGTAQTKNNEPKSEIAWDIRNDSASTIRINKFAISWTCLNDPDSVCSEWKFDYLKFDINNANKIYEGISPVDNNNSFPLTVFDTNVGDTSPYINPYIDIAPGQTIPINEMEFVDNAGIKYDNIQAGTSVDFTVTWGDINGNTYTQIFNVTW